MEFGFHYRFKYHCIFGILMTLAIGWYPWPSYTHMYSDLSYWPISIHTHM